VDGALDAASRGFKSLDEVKDQARREIMAAQQVAKEASGSMDDAQHELDVTQYWLGAVQDKVDREVRQARKAAARLRRVRKKQKGSESKAPWLQVGGGSEGEELHMGVNPLHAGADQVEAFALVQELVVDDLEPLAVEPAPRRRYPFQGAMPTMGGVPSMGSHIPMQDLGSRRRPSVTEENGVITPLRPGSRPGSGRRSRPPTPPSRPQSRPSSGDRLLGGRERTPEIDEATAPPAPRMSRDAWTPAEHKTRITDTFFPDK